MTTENKTTKTTKPAIAVEPVLGTVNIKPDPLKYGYIPSTSFDDGGETGWCLEGGKEAYYEALKRYEFMKANGLGEQDMINDITLPH